MTQKPSEHILKTVSTQAMRNKALGIQNTLRISQLGENYEQLKHTHPPPRNSGWQETYLFVDLFILEFFSAYYLFSFIF